VASITGNSEMLGQFALVLEAGGFEQCTNEEWLVARWSTWNDGDLEIEGDEVKKKKKGRKL